MAEGPKRTCLGCRKIKAQAQLIRIVRSPAGEVLIDLQGRLPGRGAYLCNGSACIEAAIRKQQLDRAFRQTCEPVTAAELEAKIRQELQTHMANLLGMARKSAKFVAGSNAVLDALKRKTPLALIVLATDISQQIGEKVSYKAAQQNIVTTRLFDKLELGHILGRVERSVVGLPEGKLADAFLADLHRYQEISGEN